MCEAARVRTQTENRTNEAQSDFRIMHIFTFVAVDFETVFRGTTAAAAAEQSTHQRLHDCRQRWLPPWKVVINEA